MLNFCMASWAEKILSAYIHLNDIHASVLTNFDGFLLHVFTLVITLIVIREYSSRVHKPYRRLSLELMFVLARFSVGERRRFVIVPSSFSSVFSNAILNQGCRVNNCVKGELNTQRCGVKLAVESRTVADPMEEDVGGRGRVNMSEELRDKRDIPLHAACTSVAK